MQEVCAVRRAAALECLAREQEAALRQAREKVRSETPGRIHRYLAPLRARQRAETKSLRKRRREPRR
jgi:hypothetical protein